jgi:hypothetical protein
MDKHNYDSSISERTRQKIEPLIDEFLNEFSPIEKRYVHILNDQKNSAIFIECHICGKDIVDKSTIDVPIDPESQADYRANREVVEDHAVFIKMKEDALSKRTFSNIVAEYTTGFNKDFPLKIIGGQHRFLAIKEAFEKGINQLHGVKVYFDLNSSQRLDLQLISNSNISVSADLLDRMYETMHGPELRNWCQKVGLLETEVDFSDKKTQSSQITVRAARTFILNYLAGTKIKDTDFDKKKTIPVLSKTGDIDDEWERLRRTGVKLWENESLLEAAREFSELNNKQRNSFAGKKSMNYEYANKALNYAVLSAWAYVAGVLSKNRTRLQRHYNLRTNSSGDPLNSTALAKGKHKTDPENYRGLGTRTDAKERGRLAEVFFLQAEKGTGITSGIIDVAIKKYHMKQALLDVSEAESKLK